jgi:hypothetical protein
MRASDLIDTPFIDVQTIGDIISPIQYVPFLERRLDLSSLQSVGDVHFETDDKIQTSPYWRATHV